MRRRLLVPMLTLMVVVLVALGVPLAANQARSAARDTYLDRWGDAARFASLAGREPLSAEQPLLARELGRYEQVYGIAAAFLDREGNVLAASHPGFQVPPGPGGGWLDVALGGRRPDPPAAMWPWDRDDLLVAEPVVDGGDVVGVLVTISPTAKARSLVLAGWGMLAAVIAGALVLCVLLAVMMARWILRPVRVVDQVAHDLATGELDARVPVEHGPPELRRLGSSFNEMADSLSTVLERQRSFVADASHQLRNQLHALMLRLDAIALSGSPAVTQDADLAAAEGRRLATMLDQLLELARAEHAEAALQPTDLSALVDRRIDVWRGAAEQREIRLCRDGDALVAGHLTDPRAVDSALDVLLDNAIKFAPRGSVIVVDVRDRGDELRICVVDQGSGLTPSELDRIGDRFWRSPRHQNVPGSGLGLSIARTLLTAAGARLELANGEAAGLRATIRLP